MIQNHLQTINTNNTISLIFHPNIPMDITTFLKDNNFSSPLFFFTTIFLVLLVLKQTKLFCYKSDENLPPGPTKLPIIGNLHQLGDKPHVTLANLAKRHGPLISLGLGKQLLVVASTPEAAKEILQTHDRLLSARSVPSAFQQPSLLPHSLMWNECNQTWKTLRTLCRTEMFSVKALESHSRLREENFAKLIDFLRKKQGQVINMEDMIFTTLFNTLTSIIFAKQFIDLADENETHDLLKETINKVIEYAGRFFEGFDLHGTRKGAMKEYKKIFACLEDTIEERRACVNSSTWSSEKAQSFLDRLLENGFSNNQIYQPVLELLVAGTNTTTTTVIWAMSELVRNKDVMSKIQEEIKNETTSDQITNSQLSKLTYLQACIKETFRLHPPVPLLLPHKAVETCKVMNYTIPKNAKIHVNLWAMGRDPKVWDNPLSFNPERFMNSKVDFKGQDFELLPFGSGRRACPGMPSGIKSVESVLACLIREFDWDLPNGDDPSKLDLNERFGLALKREKPLMLIFKQRN
ncbi:putative N-methylcoclaurine 3'-monooxygenase [Helianthus annuus]|nr:putative N-methylcoclaurine 3'-monooxygenase [Helianthus annuus]